MRLHVGGGGGNMMDGSVMQLTRSMVRLILFKWRYYLVCNEWRYGLKTVNEGDL